MVFEGRKGLLLRGRETIIMGALPSLVGSENRFIMAALDFIYTDHNGLY